MLLFTHIASLPPGTVVYDWPGALFIIEPKLVRAQTYPDGTFLVWKETIPRILDIPLCKYPLGNKIPHIEEQSDIYIKLITARQKKKFIPLQALSYKEYMYIFFWLGNLLFSGCPEQRLATIQVSGLSSKVRGGEI